MILQCPIVLFVKINLSSGVPILHQLLSALLSIHLSWAPPHSSLTFSFPIRPLLDVYRAGTLRAALLPKLSAASGILLKSFLSFHFQNWRESKDTMHRIHMVPLSVSPLLALLFLGIDLTRGCSLDKFVENFFQRHWRPLDILMYLGFWGVCKIWGIRMPERKKTTSGRL